jgi:hypothetical protein
MLPGLFEFVVSKRKTRDLTKFEQTEGEGTD